MDPDSPRTSRSTHFAAALVALMVVTAGCSSSNGQRADDRSEEARASSASTSSDSSKGPSAQTLFEKGNESLQSQDWTGAIDAYRRAVERDADRWEIHLNLAIALGQDNQFRASVQSIRRAFEAGGDDQPEVYYNLGNIYQERGLYHDAIRAYRTSLAHRDEPDVDTLVNIGSALSILDRLDDARETYRRAAELAPRDPRILHGQAVVLFLEGKHRESIDAYRRLHDVAPDYAPGYYDQSAPYVRLDEYDEAIRVLRKYLELDPEGQHAKGARALIENYQARIEEGRESDESLR